MKEQDDELWLKKVRESLESYSETPPADSWERLEGELYPRFSVRRGMRSYKMWGAAAAIVFLLLGGGGIYLLSDRAMDYIPESTSDVLSPDKVPNAPLPESPLARTELLSVASPKVKREQPQAAQESDGGIIDITTTDISAEPEAEAEPESLEKPVTGKSEPERKTTTRPSSGDKYHVPVEAGKKQKKDWSLGVSVNSSAGVDVSGSGKGGGDDYARKLDMSNSSEEPTVVPLNSNIIFADGVPYMTGNESSDQWDHKQPVSFGISVRKELIENIHVESGVVYTLLSSEVKGGEGKKKKQSFHYVGIPVRLNWDFMNYNRFSLYLAGGGMVERCVYGKTAGQKNTINRLQFSVNGAVGAQFTLYKNIGLYAEPGVSYFFDDGSNVPTFRSDRRFNFNLQAGLRFTY